MHARRGEPSSENDDVLNLTPTTGVKGKAAPRTADDSGDAGLISPAARSDEGKRGDAEVALSSPMTAASRRNRVMANTPLLSRHSRREDQSPIAVGMSARGYSQAPPVSPAGRAVYASKSHALSPATVATTLSLSHPSMSDDDNDGGHSTWSHSDSGSGAVARRLQLV